MDEDLVAKARAEANVAMKRWKDAQEIAALGCSECAWDLRGCHGEKARGQSGHHDLQAPEGPRTSDGGCGLGFLGPEAWTRWSVNKGRCGTDRVGVSPPNS